MEASTVGGRETSTGSAPAKKGKEDYNNTNREIDQEHLAKLLRESAELVERGEFGSVLYETLQDFRAYYKQKYPKTGKKKKGSKKNDRRSSSGKTSTTTTSSEKNNASASSAILEDLKESEKNAEKTTAIEDSKSEIDGDSTLLESERSIDLSSRSFLADKKVNAQTNHNSPEHPEATSAKENDIAAQSISEEASNVKDIKSSIPVSAPASKANVSSGPSTPPRGAIASEDPEEPTPTESTDPGGLPEYYNASTQKNSRTPFLSTSTPTRGAVFGKKLKFGAALQNVKKGAMNMKKAAKNVTEKISENIDKHHHKTSSNTRDDLEFFAETGVEKAESSGRRTLVNTDDSNNNSQEFGTSSEFKSRVTPGVAGASDAGSPASEHDPNSANNSDGQNNDYYQYSHNDNHGRPISDRNLGQPSSDRNIGKPTSDRNLYPTATNQRVPAQFGSSSYGQQNTADTPDPGETFENDDSHDSFGDRVRANSSVDTDETDPIMEVGLRPKFQRPANTSSSLIVSGWIEQYRRSKMRHVWKEVLVSLVEGRKPGEVTTLWIQREIIQPSTGLKELEALHRIPMKILEDVSFTENTTDNQFRLKIYHGTEDFVFRCDEAPNDALRWVQILKKHKKLAGNNSESTASQDSSFPNQQQNQQPPSTKGMAIRDLRAICHGAGVNTAGMERAQLEAAAEKVQQRGTYFDQRGQATGTIAPTPYTQQSTPQQQPQQPQYPNTNQANMDPTPSRPAPPVDAESKPPQQEQQQEQPKKRLGIKELRAICHGAGISTAGMERRELEAAAKEVQSRGTYFDPPIANQAPNDDDARARQEELRRQQQQQQQEEQIRRRQDAEERHRREVEEAQRRAAVAEQEQRRRTAEEEARRRAIAEEQRRRAAEEEARRRAAAEEQLRRQREAQAAQVRYAQQQAAWQQQQQAEEQRRRVAEQQAAGERRRREEAIRKEQEWATHNQQQQAHHYQQQQQRQQAYPQQQWQQQQQRPPPQQHYQPQQQQQRSHTPDPAQQHHQQQPRNQTPPPPPHQQRQQSGSDNKYAKMANQSGDDGQAAITKIKHGVLIQWALQPPQLQMLRPIAALVTTIHTVFPPALGVSVHEYFNKWKPITRQDVAGVNGLPEEAKLKKAVRKIRFFLHPDKLPHDLDEEQKFTVKMLWDITSDAWEEYQKHKEDLDWVN